jgi:hypothetical protein
VQQIFRASIGLRNFLGPGDTFFPGQLSPMRLPGIERIAPSQLRIFAVDGAEFRAVRGQGTAPVHLTGPGTHRSPPMIKFGLTDQGFP